MAGMVGAVAWIGFRFFLRSVADSDAASVSMPERDTGSSSSVLFLESAEADIQLQHHQCARSMVVRASGSIAVPIFAIAATFALSGRIALDPLGSLWTGLDAHIRTVLNPDALAIPRSLPPSVFVDPDIPSLKSADRDWSKLDPVFARTVLMVIARMEARGYPVTLLEGYRSPERQDVLAASAVRVTNARAYQSRHQFGFAADLAPIRDGRLHVSEREAWAMQAYIALGEEAEAAGLVWGGRWELRDYGHVELSEKRRGRMGSK